MYAVAKYCYTILPPMYVVAVYCYTILPPDIQGSIIAQSLQTFLSQQPHFDIFPKFINSAILLQQDSF